MAFRMLAGLMAALFISISSWADEIQLNPAHPEQYTIVKGDTLWNISGKFLNHPWQWPELWKNNAQIKNPYLIYPGDTIYFSIANGKPQLSLSQDTRQVYSPEDSTCVLNEDDVKKGRTNFAVSKTGKLLPCIRETVTKQAIKLIPTESIAQFLISPKVMSENELNNAAHVDGLAAEHLVVGAGDKIYVRAISQQESPAYSIYHIGDTYVSPETGKILGYEGKYVAEAQLQQAGDPATLIISTSNSEIHLGDLVMPKTDEEFTLNYFPRPPETSINGSIIGVPGGVSQIGLLNVVVIDKGTKDGLLMGHELAIYQNSSITTSSSDAVKLPDEQVGTLMVFRPFERVSYALVMKAAQAIHILDKVKTP
jgi:hypothetical protein